MRVAIRALLVLLALIPPLTLPASVRASGAQPYNARVDSLVVTPSTPSALYSLVVQTGPWAGDDQRWRWLIFASGDGGKSWTPYTMRGLENASRLFGLTLDYRAPANTLYVLGETPNVSGTQLFRSRAGDAWVEVGATTQQLTTVAIDFLDGNVLYGGFSHYGTVGEFVRSADGGRTWHHFDTGAPPPGQPGPPPAGSRVSPGGPVQQILVDPTNPGTLYALTAYTYKAYGSALWRGDRQGNWVQLPLPPVLPGGQGSAGLAFDAARGVLYTGSWAWGGAAKQPDPAVRGLWRTANPRDPDPSRVTWTLTRSWDFGAWGWFAGLPSVLPLAVDAGQERAIYLQTHGADAALWKSRDTGQTWQPLPIPRLQGDLVPGGGGDAWTAPTGHTVSGDWLRFLKEHGDVDNLGYPRSAVIADPVAAGQTVQYFQRAVLEWHPEAPSEYRIQRRLLGDLLDPGADPPLSTDERAARVAEGALCFPDGPGLGLGHCVADAAPDGTPIWFRDHFESHGAAGAFGFPKEEPKLRNGRWTQRFQAAVFEHHPEHDVDGFVPGTTLPLRNFRVQLELLGDRYVELWKLPYQ